LIPEQAHDIFLWYSGILALGVVYFLWRRPDRQMRLRIRAGLGRKKTEIKGMRTPDKFSHIKPDGERPLNVVFNYNGHSWDAYEVLGLPAGSSFEKAQEAYQASLKKVDAGSRPFIEAAFTAIQTQWGRHKASGTR
jgi:hypothetical protein